MIEIKPPAPFKTIVGKKLFLAGSIEMGLASAWQDIITVALDGRDIIILNPRRTEWDSTWVQSREEPLFAAQVNWELDGIDDADIVVVYFDPNTKSPITLMELGYAIGQGRDNILVCCPYGFWRKGNVDILCERNGHRVFESLDGLKYYLTQIVL